MNYLKKGMLKHISDKIFLAFHKRIKPRIVCNFVKEKGITCGSAAGIFVTYKNLSKSDYISQLINSINTIKTENTKSLITEKIHTLSQEDIKDIEDNCGLKVLNGRSEIVDHIPYLLREMCRLRKRQLNEKEIIIISDNTVLTKKLTVNMARYLRFLTIMSRDMTFVEKLEKEVLSETGLSLQTMGKLDRTVQNFDIIINMTSDVSLDTYNIKRGAIIIDISIGRVLKKVNNNRKDLIIITDLLFANNGILKSNPEVFSFDNKIPSYIYEGIKTQDNINPVAIRVNNKDYSIKELVDTYYGKSRNSSVFLLK
ncbi:hypothetical protein DW1_2643 [Proteiniborus sp. DW1]|uniref:hypothetical protein n=1 Tax=Proteiniborus sp. DW1 TaxID=1889883 RepID=UPI00092E0CDC|nr:hypothetical protein [Proteiniborus sp. DW1]SCG84203.1 hypothetical protein DW1_2643 [Proteiniborus sp. DW1]